MSEITAILQTGNPFEALSEELIELFPIKLIGGFISIDSHIGCSGCSFCLARRSSLCERLFTENIHHDPAWLTASLLFMQLRQMPSFREARVPIRFGHNTDASFQWEIGVALASMMPEGYPFVMLTRQPVPAHRLKQLTFASDAILKLTITPTSELLDHSPDLQALIETAHNTPKERLFVLIGPVADDSIEHVEELLEALPPGIFLDIKPVTVESIPGLSERMTPHEHEVEALRQLASSMGFFVTDYFTCLTRSRARRPFFKFRTAPEYMMLSCQNCPNFAVCQEPIDEESVAVQVQLLAASLGLMAGKHQREADGTLRFAVDKPISRGDETFLSEMVNYPIRLDGRTAGTEGGCFSTEAATVLQRWEKQGFFPSSDMVSLAQKIASELPHGIL